MYSSSRKPETKNTSRDYNPDPNTPYATGPYHMAYQASPNTAINNGPIRNDSGRYVNANGYGSRDGMTTLPCNFTPTNISVESCTRNLYGRSFKETLADFPKVCRPDKKPRGERDYTPSLVSDDSDSTDHTSSSYGPPPVSAYYRDGNSSAAPPPPSAFTKDGSTNLAPKIYLASQNAYAQPFNNYGHIQSIEGAMGNFGGNAYYNTNTNTAYEGDVYMGQQKSPYDQAPRVKHSQSTARQGELAKWV